MKITALIVASLVAPSFAQARECLPAREEKDFPAELANAAYMRFSPDGNFVIGWGEAPNGNGGKTYLVDLRGSKPRKIITPLGVEAYPVEGDWELLGSSSPGTSYYETAELLKGKIFNKAAFSRPVGGLYHASGTLLSEGNRRIIRTATYGLEFNDTEVEIVEGRVIKHRAIDRGTKYLCHNLGEDGKSPKLMEFMISKDGKEMVGIPPEKKDRQGFLNIYKINEDLTCSVEEVPIYSQKPMFSHPRPGKKGYIAFQTGGEVAHQPIPFGQVSIYDRDLKKYLRASLPGDRVVSFSPGTLKDGRVVFIRDAGNGKAKLVIVDPYQATPEFAKTHCLTKDSSEKSSLEKSVK